MLPLRPEVLASDGGIGDLQMSLHKAVYQTVNVAYREVGYFADITQPTPNLVQRFQNINMLRLTSHLGRDVVRGGVGGLDWGIQW